MRLMNKTTLGVLLAVLALSAVASASASAEACTKKAGSKNYFVCIAGAKLGSPTVRASAPFGGHLRLGTTARVSIDYTSPIRVTCSAVSAENGLAQSGGGSTAQLAGFALAFSGCKVKLEEGESGELCHTEGFRWGGGTGLTGSFGPSAETITLTTGTHYLGALTLLGSSCYLAVQGEYPFKGKAECTLKEAEVEAIKKTIVCTEEKTEAGIETRNLHAGLKLEEEVELTEAHKGQKFSVVEG
jgi:hypothetical protein